MKILLIQPAKPSDHSEAAKSWSLCKPMSLLYLYAALEQHGRHSASILDFEKAFAEDKNINIYNKLKNISADIYGVTATTFTRFEAINIIRIVKEIFPERKVIVGGVHFMYTDVDVLTHIKEVDYVIRGEGEVTLPNLLDVIENGGDISQVRGISYRKNNIVIRNPDQDLFNDLDNVPIYKYKTPLEYPEFLMGPNQPVPAVSIMTSRGCPNNCIFCAKAGMKYRHHSTDYVIKEIEYYKENYDIHAFNFLDLTFTANPRRSQELCEAIIEKKINIKWWCETRANIPLDLLDIMYRAGCRYLVMGVETGSEKVMQNLHKGISKNQINNVVEYATKIGINVQCYFMFSHLGETFEDAMETLNYMDYLKDKFGVQCGFQPCMILPGSQIEKISLERGLLPDHFSWSIPYEDKKNEELEQLATIPLFFDLMSFEQVKSIFKMSRYSSYISERYVTSNIMRIFKAVYKYGFFKVLYTAVNDLTTYIKYKQKRKNKYRLV